MQTQKARNGSPDVPKKVSPRASRSLKIGSLESESSSPPVSANNRTPKDKSPKVLDRRSPRSPVSEKKRPSRITELESLVSQLQEELKKAKDQISVSETSKKQAEEEAERSRKELQEVSSKLEENQNQFFEVSPLEEETDNTYSLVHQGIISQECDLEFSATAGERAGLAAVAHEIRQLKLQIEMVASSEAGHVKQAELHNSEVRLLRGNLMDTIFLVESFKNQLTNNCEVSEAETEAMATETLRQLENAKKAVEELKSDGTKAVESYKKMAVELQQSKSRMAWLEALVNKLQTSPEDLENHETLLKDYESLKRGESNEMEEEVSSLRCEVERLRAALEASDRKDQEGNVEASSRLRIQAELQSELKIAKSEIDELKARLMAKETELQFISEDRDNLCQKLIKNQKEIDVEAELKKLREGIENLKADLMDKETELQIVSDENETLKSDIHKRETDVQDAFMKLGIAMEEADKSSKRAVRVTEQLEATQTSNSEMETELRKLKVQSNQWRKAAEAATAMLSAGNNGNYNQTNSPYSEDIEDELTKKKNGNVLKKIGVLWKKPQK
ncbi:PREDICTED: interactor of constitutive active ROPs 3-like isoform X1 [Camelina sativa]|uniref:Interactor of constitutive active ROPs 3-like isoform X1 n=1 Tax=Camelina sativa TaxID=90675 RepID=A0ABM1R251_CAMSA|nr:PREDICTED: interactor of constitutive active ROPs 3-like isoform X1 [Camelina sativa]XP_010456116.1 PREDICTED: interactor of constitutive active ROPs 3-like isoform X2 [Camelina sativa]XP_019093089.1 PREDICTED: interactor of constitutive active ROPs 3-like isoform X1 [Camelina sativa]